MSLFSRVFVSHFVLAFACLQPVLAKPVPAAHNAAGKSAAGDKSGQTEWLFVQQHIYSGLHKILWTANAIRIDCEQQGYSLVAHAPEWKLYAFRNDDKVYRQNTLSDFFHEFPYNAKTATSQQKQMLKLETIEKDGLKIGKYHVGGSFAQTLYLVESPQVAPQVSDLLLAFYRCRPSVGVLYKKHKESNGMPAMEAGDKYDGVTSSVAGKDVIRTTEVKKLPYNPSDFECPKGYKLAAKEQIFLSKSQKKQAESLLEDLNVGGKFGTK